MENKTVRFRPQLGDPKLVLFDKGKIRVAYLRERSEWKMGNALAPESVRPQIALESRIVSRVHGTFRSVGDFWLYEYVPTTNATFLNGERIILGAEERVHRIELKSGDILRIDYADLTTPDLQNGVWILYTEDTLQGTWNRCALAEGQQLLVGRAADCDVRYDLPYISAHHIMFRMEKGMVTVEDCDSLAGTYVNGKRIAFKVGLSEKDVVSICDCYFLYSGGALYFNQRPPKTVTPPAADASETMAAAPGGAPAAPIQEVSAAPAKETPAADTHGTEKEIVLEADIRSMSVGFLGRKTLLSNVHVKIARGTSVAVIGASGAGKTTLVGCISGQHEKFDGKVLLYGMDLYQKIDQLRPMIGSVPQMLTVPVQKTVATVMKEWIDEGPLKLKPQEREERIEEILKQLRLTDKRDTKIASLSGGEQKRVNIAVAFASDQDVLFLDEPDAGLDSKSKDELFAWINSLAHERNIAVVSIIHDAEYLEDFDQLIVLTKGKYYSPVLIGRKMNEEMTGRLAFSGSPADAKEYFGVEHLHDIYDKLAADPERYIMED